MRRIVIPAFLTAGLAATLFTVACDRKDPAVQQAQEAAATEDARVARLEKELADLKSGKSVDGDAETHAHVSASRKKALEKELADARRRAGDKRKEAESLGRSGGAKAEVLVVPADTKFSVKLARDLATDKDQAGDAWEGTLAEPITVGGKVAWPAGTAVKGVVTQSTPAGRLASGKGALGIKVTEIGTEGVDTDTHVVVGEKTGARNAKYIGGGAALGALVGMLSDKHNKGDHALGGAAIGAAAGTAAAAATADTIIKIPASAPLAFTLAGEERVTIKH